VTNHNYLHYLPNALSSIQAQILKPKDVIVVDDGSCKRCEDLVKQFGYRYLRTEFKNPLYAREAGFKATNSELVCFLDADDRLPPNYLADATSTITQHGVDIAFSDLQYFGHASTLVKFPNDIQPKRLWQTNFLHVGCVVSRIAIELSEPFKDHPDNKDYHEDWLFWRKVVEYGFRYAKNHTPYEARLHNTNRSIKIHERGYLAERRANNLQEFIHQHKDKTSITFLRFLNKIAKTSTGDYVCLKYTPNAMDFPQYDWPKFARHLDSDVAAVHDEQKALFDHTMFVGPVFRDYIYTNPTKLPFHAKTERVINI